MVPGLIAFRDVICDKLGSVWGKFWTSIIKMFLLPDTDDWVDTGLWLLGWTIQIGGVVASTVSGGAAGVLGTAANAGIQGARFVKAVTKVLNAIIRPLMKMMHPIVKYGRQLSKSSSFLIRTAAKSTRWFGRNVVLGAGKFRLGGKDRFNPNAWRKRIGAIRRRYNLSKKVIELIDLYNVDKSDVKAM
jgi:hypothetical protein